MIEVTRIEKKSHLIRSNGLKLKTQIFPLAKMLGVCDYIRNTIFNKLTNGDKLNVPKGEIFN